MITPVLESSREPEAGWACRWCRSVDGTVVLDLGDQSAADDFPSEADPWPDAVHPLAMIQCQGCHLVQLESDPTSPDEPRGVEPMALRRQASDAIDSIAAAGLLPPEGALLEHPSPHGGSWVGDLTARGLREVDCGPADVVIDAFGMMHDPDQRTALQSRVDELGTDGVLFLQFHTLAAIVSQGMWNALRHGHFAYYSTPVLVNMAEELGLQAVGVWEFELYGGTIMLAFGRGGHRSEQVNQLINEEVSAGVLDARVVSTLQEAVTDSVTQIRHFLDSHLAAGRTIAGYGAASRSVALLAIARVRNTELLGIGDASPAKVGRCLPGGRIPVISTRQLTDMRPDRVLLFVPDLLDEVRSALPQIEQHGGRWVVLDPEPVEIQPVGATLS